MRTLAVIDMRPRRSRGRVIYRRVHTRAESGSNRVHTTVCCEANPDRIRIGFNRDSRIGHVVYHRCKMAVLSNTVSLSAYFLLREGAKTACSCYFFYSECYAMSGWTNAETTALIGLWGDESVQEKLRGPAKTKPVFEKIAEKLRQMGYDKTGVQCQTKIKNLTSKYWKVKDNNRKSGSGTDASFPFFDAMDDILGTRAASEPPIIVDSGTSISAEEDEILGTVY